jgi:ATP-dependent Clp protease ATP-binding subunit ClpA
MFERFTDRARRVVVLAQEEARMLNHNYIGTEHILLGLIHEGEGVAAKALESLGISLDAVRGQVEEIIGQGQAAPTGHIPFTPRAKKVLELSLREALQLGHNYIGTEHILLGLIREGEGVAAQVLQKLGADLNRVRAEVVQLLQGYVRERGGPPGNVIEAELRLSAAGLGGVSPMSEETIRVLDLARKIATRMAHESVEPTDILLGLLGSAELDVAVLLQRLGVDLALLKQRLDEMASMQAASHDSPSSEEPEAGSSEGARDDDPGAIGGDGA